jgi:predicted aspartyl protease
VSRRTILTIAVALTLASNIVAADTSTCKMVQIADLPVRLERNRLIVDGAINGQKIGIMLDTGAERSLIPRSAAVRLGLGRQVVRGYRMVGVGGETQVEAAYIEEFKIGQATRKGWRVIVAGEKDLGENIAFILGDDFFQQVDVEFDLAHGAVRLFQPKDCDGVSLAYWATEGIGEVEMERVTDAHPQIVLTVQINGQPIKALLDSGSTKSVLNKSDAARLGVTPETPGVVAVGSGTGIGQKSIDSWIGQFDSVAFGNETIRNIKITFADLWKDATYTETGSRLGTHLAGQQSMLLGADFLLGHRLLVAHSQRKIYFTYTGGPVFQQTLAREGSKDPQPFRRTGASCQYSSECIGDLGCMNGQCQPLANAADQCRGHSECSRDEWCIGSPRRCQPRFTEGVACNKDADCEGLLKCLSDRCARPN